MKALRNTRAHLSDLVRQLAKLRVRGNVAKGRPGAIRGVNIVGERLCGRHMSSGMGTEHSLLTTVANRRCHPVSGADAREAQRMHHRRRPSRGLLILIEVARLLETETAFTSGTG